MNIANLLRRAAADDAGQVALRLQDEEIGYDRMAEVGGRLAAYLLAQGLAPGDRVGFYLPNTLEYLTGLLGVWQAGGVGVPLNHMFPDAAHRVVPRLDRDDALLMYTSGSTGGPKGVRQTHRNITAQVEGVIDLYEITSADHVLNCMPPVHVGGLQLACLPVLLRRDGYLCYVDRIDDMIVSGGENIYPQMVEEHLADCPDLAEVAVIGSARDRWVEQVTAVVVPNRPGVKAVEVAAYCATNANLAGMHRPRRIEIVDALPRTGSGKLNRPELRRMFP